MPEDFAPLQRKHLKNLQLKDRVLVWGNVIRVFETEKVSSFLIDDFTDTCNVTGFSEQKALFKGISKGDRIQVCGEVRHDRNGELYILPEIVIKIDCSTELLRRLENIEFLKNSKKSIGESQELKIEKNVL